MDPALEAFASCKRLTSLKFCNIGPNIAGRLHELLRWVTSTRPHFYDPDKRYFDGAKYDVHQHILVEIPTMNHWVQMGLPHDLQI